MEKGIAGLVRRASKLRFGKAFGTHRFRHGLASTAARLLPGNPGIAAAAGVFQASLEEDRRQTEAIARRAFGRPL